MNKTLFFVGLSLVTALLICSCAKQEVEENKDNNVRYVYIQNALSGYDRIVNTLDTPVRLSIGFYNLIDDDWQYLDIPAKGEIERTRLVYSPYLPLNEARIFTIEYEKSNASTTRYIISLEDTSLRPSAEYFFSHIHWTTWIETFEEYAGKNEIIKNSPVTMYDVTYYVDDQLISLLENEAKEEL